MSRVLIIIALLFLSRCSNQDSSHYFDLEVLKKIERLTLIQPPPFIGFTPVYVIGMDDSISESDFVSLQDMHDNFYKKKYPAFYKFLFDVLNQKIKMDTKRPPENLFYSQTFFIEAGITRLYKEKGIKGFMDKYCIDSNGLYTLNRKNLSLNEINSISYYFFLNQYIRTDDDYNATINFRKLTSVKYLSH